MQIQGDPRPEKKTVDFSVKLWEPPLKIRWGGSKEGNDGPLFLSSFLRISEKREPGTEAIPALSTPCFNF